ncbi:hypothetical protein B0T22DRAFT_440702 [Podospora appendiculata]|uniref:Uncharacterized protein n=1 Tax=Podospora appendiculata TaxID=314037 RepID=A0AAE0XAN5_9PEZI|nr:hypothetical protein B0T22DRAFT_440702 [Podospora appendiculata]
MAKQLNATLDLLLDEAGFSDFQEEMVKILQSAFAELSDNPSASLDEEAIRAASGLRALIKVPADEVPRSKEAYYEHLGEFQEFWQGLIDIATRIPHNDDQSQALVVKALGVLRGDSSMWKDFPDLGAMMRDKWVDPTFEWHPEDEELEPYTLSNWLNLNSFVARLHGSGVFLTNSFAVWQLREGLEDDLVEAKGNCSPAEAVDNRIAVVSEWLVHAGPALLKESLLESENLDEGQKRAYGPGPLFSGRPGCNIERWGFWKRRLEELRPTIGASVAPSVDRAVQTMKASAAALVRD